MRELLLAADAAGIEIVAEHNSLHYSNFDVIQKWPDWPGLKEPIITNFKDLDIEIEKIIALVENPDVLVLMQKYLPDGLNVFVSRDDVVMVSHEEAVKSKAVAALAGHWGIKSENIVAFGDDTNDLDLLQYCGLGVVMGNGVNEVKAVADEICGSNENDGIAQWLEERIF